MTPVDDLKIEIKQAIVRSLRLPMTPEEIDDATPLFGEGLGLDSIDVLELVLEIERSFGVSIAGRRNRHAGAAVRSTRSPTFIVERTREASRREWLTARNAFTVDLEEWFHICGAGDALAFGNWDRLPSRVDLTTRIVLDLLDAANVRATFFVVGWVAERHAELVDLVRRAGHEIGSHGHIHERAFDLGRDRFRADVRESVRVLSAVTGGRVTMFRAPEWSINERSPWALEVLVEEGFTARCEHGAGQARR